MPLLGKRHPDRPKLTPLPFIFQLLHAKNVHGNVRIMIMEMVENLLGVKEANDEETEMETDEELLPIEAGESVLSSNIGKICISVENMSTKGFVQKFQATFYCDIIVIVI